MHPAARRRLEPDARREQILTCAVRLFGERPYAEVSTTEIATAAGVARGLVNHYFGTKRDLYLAVVHAMVDLPWRDTVIPARGSLATRVDRSVEWFLDTVAARGATFVAVTRGVGDDPEVERILAAADDAAARVVLAALGVPASARRRAAVRAYGALAKSAVAEWIRAGTLTRADVHLLLSTALVAIVRDVLPDLPVRSLRRRTR